MVSRFSCSFRRGQCGTRSPTTREANDETSAPIGAHHTAILLGCGTAVAGDRGELTSSFHNELNQLRSTVFDVFDRPDGYIGDSDEGPELICADLAVGTWFSWFNSEGDALEMVTVEIRLWRGA